MSFLDQRELGNPAPSEVSHLKVGSVGDDQGTRSSTPASAAELLSVLEPSGHPKTPARELTFPASDPSGYNRAVIGKEGIDARR